MNFNSLSHRKHDDKKRWKIHYTFMNKWLPVKFNCSSCILITLIMVSLHSWPQITCTPYNYVSVNQMTAGLLFLFSPWLFSPAVIFSRRSHGLPWIIQAGMLLISPFSSQSIARLIILLFSLMAKHRVRLLVLRKANEPRADSLHLVLMLDRL